MPFISIISYMEESLMTIEIRFSVISPEAGVQKGTGEFPPGMGAPSPSSSSFAKRLDTLENKTLYLVDTGFGGGYNFMLQLQRWFAEHMPSVTTIRKRKPGNVFMDDNDDLWKEIKAKGHAAVLGVAG
jgi:hypothetical protein